MEFLNTLTGKKEQFIPASSPVHLFVCGPTVYDLPHIGHGRTYVAFDILVRWMRSQGLDVFYLQNITDVDDKIIDRAQEHEKDPLAFAHEMEAEYKKDMDALRVTSVTQYARASDHIADIVEQIKVLLSKSHAYLIADDGYYFDITTFEDYGKLSNRTTQQAEDAVSRIDDAAKKRNRGDFALWKFPKAGHDAANEVAGDEQFAIVEGEPSWKTELGWGRPGWHIEDTAITEHFFGPQYDLHGGGVDLKFPHHEAEIAQQESASGKKPFVRTWLHTGHLLINGEKMSKSKGNFITIRDFLKNYPPEVLRLLITQHHYRSPMDYTDRAAQQARASYSTLWEFVHRLNALLDILPKESTFPQHIYNNFNVDFSQAMNDDLNTPAALARIFTMIRETEQQIDVLDAESAKTILAYISQVLDILNLPITPAPIPQQIKDHLQDREAARNNKEYKKADKIRDTLSAAGYKIEDTPHGPIALPLPFHG